MKNPMPQEEVLIPCLEVKVVGENFEDAMRKFKTTVQKSGVLLLFREKSRYEKPSDKKRRKERETIEYNLMLKAREEQIKSGEFEKIQKKKELKRRQKAIARQTQRLLENKE